MHFNLFLYHLLLVMLCINMDIAKHIWTSRLAHSSKCTFPDCINESSCQCSKCFNLYCNTHLQIHYGFCNDLAKVTEGPSRFEIPDQMQSMASAFFLL
jgi:hypothetical protein